MHDVLMSCLASIPMDCTNNQGKFSRLDLSKPSFCFDLANCTDRFPISFQKRVLESITSKLMADSWEKILIGLPFKYLEEDYSYKRGQPMGAYTSFPMFALSHHVLIKVASLRADIKHYKDYAVLGDDVIIQNELVASHYRNLMKELDVEISVNKSFCGNTIEFAKRYFHNGVEFTGFSISALYES